jgi:peptide/nickel transport system substrate-binding protein
MRSFHGRRGLLGGALTVAVAGSMILMLAVGPVSSATGAANKAHVTVVKGGTATFAEPAGGSPNYIFPFAPFRYFSVDNLSQFQMLMYRPLFWFGNGSNPTINLGLSLANYPTFSGGGKTVTVTLKNYVWSDGEKVDAQDVVFWMNFMKLEKGVWAGYVPGTIPDDVASIATPNSTTVVFKLTGSVNPYWWVYNELSQITPLPMAWDVTAKHQKPGTQACGKASYGAVAVKSTSQGVVPANGIAKNCVAVFTFLSKEAGYDPSNPKGSNNAFATYATNPLWQVVDGPWHLTYFSPSGLLRMKPNPTYSGPVKPTLAVFEELPFTSATTEFNELVSGQVTYGYIPAEDITKPAPSPTKTGPNNPRVAAKFNLEPWYMWGISYFPLNFNSVDDGGYAGKIYRQLYFRQALQTLINQPLLIKKINKGYGVPTYGPVPVVPANSFVTKYEETNPYPYSVKNAEALLSSNGWTINPGGTDVCADASKCGVPAGTPLSFNMMYITGSAAVAETVAVEVSAWAQAGIHVTASAETFNTVYGTSTPCSGASCTWSMSWWGGWSYAPDYWPSGEDLFETGSASNAGSYSSATNDKLIKATNFGTASLAQWENYAAKALPVIWEPSGVYTTSEIAKNLQGASPQNPLLMLTPENWYFTK